MMEGDTQSNKRVAKNTILLYFRMIFLMLISLYISRVVLNTLGVVDYGIYNVVGGIVTILAFLHAAMNVKRLYEVFKKKFCRMQIVIVWHLCDFLTYANNFENSL